MAGINPLASALYNNNYLLGTQHKKQQDSISKLWSGYTSSQANATGALPGLTEISANLKSLLASHEEAKNAFYTELGENMDALADSADTVENYNFHVAKEGAITRTNTKDEDGNVTTMTTYSKDLRAALNTVKEFVNDYNTSVRFFKDNASVSKRVENMASIFGDTSYRATNYEAIGLTVNSDGSLSINEDKLVNEILENPDKISRTLGKDGLAGKAEEHIAFAASQADKLFPTAEEMFGDQISAASLYTGKAYQNMAAYANMGNLLNMML